MQDKGSYYPDMDSDQPQEDSGDKEPQKSDYETFLVPKSSLSGDVSVGQTEEIEVVHIFEDEVECRCKGSDKEKPKSAMDEADESMNKMAGMEG